MSDHFGTLCIKGLKAVMAGDSLISAGLDIVRKLCFLSQNTPNLPTTLGLEILPTNFVQNTSKF